MSAFVRSAETDIAAPADAVFEYVADVARHAEWADQPMTVEHVSGPTRGPGATFRTHVDIDLPVGHMTDDATVVVLETVTPRRVTYEATDSGGHFRWTVDLTGIGSATHVTQTVERLDAPLWMRVAQPLMWRAMGRKMVAHGLAHMKDRLERPGATRP